MRKTNSIVALVIFLLTSCSPAQLSPIPTGAPTSTAVATATSLPTATPTVEVLSSSTPAPEVVGPSDEILNQIYAEAGIVFPPETTAEFSLANGENACTFRYSNNVLKSSQIDYLQLPESIREYFCLTVWSNVMSIQQNNSVDLTKEFGKYPKLSVDQTFEIQDEMRNSAKMFLENFGEIPFAFWNPEGNDKHISNISQNEMNHVTKAEFEAVKTKLGSENEPFSTFSEYITPGDPREFPEASGLLFVQNGKLIFFSYNWGKLMDRGPGGIADPHDGYTTLEFMKPLDHAYMYRSVVQDMQESIGIIIQFTIPIGEWVERQGETNNKRYDNSVLFGENEEALKKLANETFTKPNQ